MQNLRVILFIIIFSSCLNPAHAQMDASKWQFYAKYSRGLTTAQIPYSYGGMAIEYQFRPRWTLNWNLDMQTRKDNVYQLHGPMGLIGGPAFTVWAINRSWGFEGVGSSILFGLLIMTAPEGISYHIPVGYRWDLSPYVNVLGFDWVQTNQNDGFQSLLYSASAGMRCSYWFADRFFVKGFLETRKAGYLDLSIGGGVALGWSIPNQAISENGL